MILVGNWNGQTSLTVNWDGSVIACTWIDNNRAYVAVPPGTTGTTVPVYVITPTGSTPTMYYNYTSASYSLEVLNDNPLAYWQMNELTGSLLLDSSGNGHTGVTMGVSDVSEAPIVGYAGPLFSATSHSVLFQGLDSYVNVANPAGFPKGNESYTLETWVLYVSGIISGTLIAIGDTGVSRRTNALFTVDANTMRNSWWGPDLDVGSLGMVANTWYHIAATYDGTTRILYFNGASRGSDTPGANTVCFESVVLGADHTRDFLSSHENYLFGRLSHTAIYGTALSSGRIAAHYAAR